MSDIPKPPFPERSCPACDAGEKSTVPPYSSIVGQMAVHSPSGNVCTKWMPEGLYEGAKKAGLIA